MARDLFIDLTNRRLAVSETNSAPAGQIRFTKGDNGAFNLYFLEATGIINRPFEVVTQPGTVKFGIGSRTGVPQSGTWTLEFDTDITDPIPFNATAAQVQSALDGILGVGEVTVTGSIDTVFTVRFTQAVPVATLSADVSQLIPDTVAVIDERIAGSTDVKGVQEIQLRLTPAVYQDSWTDLSTTVTATIATTVTGSNTTNFVQQLDFSQEPFIGTFSLRLPAASYFLEDSQYLATNGIFVDNFYNHGLSLNQPIRFGTPPVSGGPFTAGTTYFVRTIPAPNQFSVALTAGGTIITGGGEGGGALIQTFARETAPISASASAADVQAALEALDSIGAGNVVVTGIPGKFFNITFTGEKSFSGFGNQEDIEQSENYTSLTGFEITNSTTAKPGKTADVNFATFALRDLIGNEPSVDLDLEIEITEDGARSTVVLGGCSVSEELIDADSFSPVPQFAVGINSVATNYTLALSDSAKLISASTGLTITVPPNASAPFPTGSQILLYKSTTATVAITAGSGVTVNAPGSADEIASQHSIATLMKLGTDNWVLGGDIV
jgi:hypothetical protein